MSARVESPPIRGGTLGGSFVIAVVVALSIGAFLGSLVTYAIDHDGGTSHSSTFVARGTPALTAVDVGNGSKAIEGPMLAERFPSLEVLRSPVKRSTFVLRGYDTVPVTA